MLQQVTQAARSSVSQRESHNNRLITIFADITIEMRCKDDTQYLGEQP